MQPPFGQERCFRVLFQAEGCRNRAWDGSAAVKPITTKTTLLYAAGNMGANMAYAFANFAFPLFLTAYPISNLFVGLLAQERSLVGSLVQPLVGALSDRLPPNRLGRRRPFFIVGVPLTAGSLLFLSAHPTLWGVVVAITAFSVFLSVAYDPYLALMPDITPLKQRGRVGGIMAVFNTLGALTLILISFLFWRQSQQLVFWLVALGLIISFAVTFFGVNERGLPPPSHEASPKRSVGGYMRDILARRELLKYLACTFFFWLGNGGVTPFVTRFGVEVLGLAPNASFLLLLPALLGAAVFALPAGLLAERYGKKRVLGAGLFLFGAGALVGAQYVRGITDGLLLMVIIGVANAITNALIFPLLTDVMPAARAGEMTGIGSLVASIAQPIGAVAAGATADLTGSIRNAFTAGGVAMLVAFLLLLTMREPEKSDEQ